MPPAQPVTVMAISSPWVWSSLCNRLGARGWVGGSCGKGWGRSHLALSRQPLSAPFLPVCVCGGEGCRRETIGLGGITVDGVYQNTLYFLPSLPSWPRRWPSLLPSTNLRPPSSLFQPRSPTQPGFSQPALTLRGRSRRASCEPRLRAPCPRLRSPFPDSMGTGRYHLVVKQGSDTLICLVALAAFVRSPEPQFPPGELEQEYLLFRVVVTTRAWGAHSRGQIA